MRIKATGLLILAMITALLFSCTASFPAKEKVAALTNEEATELLNGKTETEIHDSWGEPDDILSGFYGDIYVCGDMHIVIYYDGDSTVTDVHVFDDRN